MLRHAMLQEKTFSLTQKTPAQRNLLRRGVGYNVQKSPPFHHLLQDIQIDTVRNEVIAWLQSALSQLCRLGPSMTSLGIRVQEFENRARSSKLAAILVSSFKEHV